MRSQSPHAQEARKTPPRLHELEGEVMEQVWHRGETSVREVMEAVNAGARRQRAYTTYMTVMARLEAKGMLERTRERKTDFYRPLFMRSEYTDLRARAEVDSIVDQFGEVALAHIARRWFRWPPSAAAPCSGSPEGSDVRADRPDGRLLVRLATLLCACGVVAAASAVGAAIGSVHHVSMAVRHLDVLGVRFSYPVFTGAELLLLGLAGLGAAAVTVAVRACRRQRAAYRDFLDQLEIVGQLEGHPTVKVIADPRPQAFCAGYLRPTVYVSQRALDLLSEPELRAVLAHEHHHRRVRDPLRLACGRITGRALFFVPALRSLWERYEDLAEVNADHAAVRASAGDQAPLASALLVFDASAPPGVSGISSERVDSLLGLPIRWQPRWWLTAASLGSLSSLGLLIWRTSEVASAHATFNLPLLSSTPCVVMSLLLPLLGCVTVVRRRASSRRGA